MPDIGDYVAAIRAVGVQQVGLPSAERFTALIGLMTSLVITVGACASSAATATSSQVSGPPTTAGPSQVGVSSAIATTAPATTAMPVRTASASPSEAFPPDSFPTDPELEAELPDSYQGIKLNKLTVKGLRMLGLETTSNRDMEGILESLGRSPDDLSFAAAADPSGKITVGFAAYRIKGADAESWAPRFLESEGTRSPGTKITHASLGGRPVKRVGSPKRVELQYFWTKGDVLFAVQATSDELASPAIAAIP